MVRYYWSGRVRIFFIISLVLALFGAAPALAAPVEGTGSMPFLSKVTLSHHGSFRFRLNMLGNHSLGLSGLSSIPAPTSLADDGSSTVFFADMRFQYLPTFKVGEILAVKARLDIFDNVVLGSTPAGYVMSPVAPTTFWTQSQDGQGLALVSVEHLYAELTPFESITLFAGRMPDQFGLGLLHHAGMGLDDDFGDTVDRVGGIVSALGFSLGFNWDFAVEGAVSDTAATSDEGQPHGLGNMDDVRQWVVTFGTTDGVDPTKPFSYAFGLRMDFRSQDMSSELPQWVSYGSSFCAISGSDTMGLNYDCYTLTPRDMFMFAPTIYGAFTFDLPHIDHLLLETEIAMIYGDFANAQEIVGGDNPMEILSVGGIVRAKVFWDKWIAGLEIGVASGDEQQQLALGPGYDPPGGVTPLNEISNLNGFMFNKGYRVDQILFREVIGTVTNAVYLKPSATWSFPLMGTHEMGVTTDLIYSFLTAKGAAPGSGRSLGLELDVTGFYTIGDTLTATLTFGSLLPLGAFHDIDTADLPEATGALLDTGMAWSIRGGIVMSF